MKNQIEIGSIILINTPSGIATAKVIKLCLLDRVQINECSLPQYNIMIVDSEDIIQNEEIEISNIAIIEKNEFAQKAIIISLEKEPTQFEQDILFEINPNEIILEF